MEHLLVLDIGGSYIKYGLADTAGHLLPETVRQTPSHADDTPEEVLGALGGIIAEASAAGPVSAASISIAGPFDYDRGVSLMQHKFKALYGVSLCPPFEASGVPVTFLHDSTAFILGEYTDGSLAGADRPCCVMLGTGLGFAFMYDGKVCINNVQTPAVRLWCSPYLDGIAEDYISTRAILKSYGRDGITVKEIANRARGGDQKAAEAFLTMGRHLSGLMTKVIRKLDCDRFALGGQIAKSADLLQLEIPIACEVTKHTDDAALRGVCAHALLGRAGCTRVMEEIKL